MDIEERHGKEPEGEQAKDESKEDSVVALVGCRGSLLHTIIGESALARLLMAKVRFSFGFSNRRPTEELRAAVQT